MNRLMMKTATAAAAAAMLVTATPAVSAEPSPIHARKADKPCNDRVVKWIEKAGIKGESRRVAWAIAQRESNGQPGESSYPDLGIVQLNVNAWQGTKYWPADIYDPVQSFTAMRKMVKDMGWQPWGLRVKGGKVSYDFSSYGGWSSWQHQNWIVIPFEKYYRQFPKACR